MKVALEAGEVLDVAILDGERVIGTLSLQLNLGGAKQRVGRPAAASPKAAAAPAAEGTGRRKKRKPMSPETRAKMAEAQRKRWESTRDGGNEAAGEGNAE